MTSVQTTEIYSSLHQHPTSADEGPQSSGEGSGLHSPVFVDPVIAGGTRYHILHDQATRDTAGLLAARFDYAQQAPQIKLESPPSGPPYHHPIYRAPIHYPPIVNANFPYTPATPQSPSPSRPAYDQPSSPSPTVPMPVHASSSPNRAESSSAAPPLSPGPVREPRRQISTAVIACRQCRSRKIRCDSTRPACGNCIRRSNVCEYDAIPKRRGPDKRPGQRLRSCKKRPADGSAPPPAKRKRLAIEPKPEPAEPVLPSSSEETMVQGKVPPATVPEDLSSATLPSPNLQISTDTVYLVKPAPSPISPQAYPYQPSPYVETGDNIWWSEFLSVYPLNDIASDLTYLFEDTGHRLSFLNLPLFLQTLSNPIERLRIQPAFILAGLAMSNLMRSSQNEYGAQGRNRALWLRDAAQGKLEASWASGWVDHNLTQAALIMALFETSAHPQYHPDRVLASLSFLDNIIRRLGLTSLDAHDRDVSTFAAHAVPVVDFKEASDDFRDRKCSCLPPDAVRPPDPLHSYTYTPPWDPTWSIPETKEEESRRVCWSALGLVASYAAQCAAFDRKSPDLFLTDPANYALLFPGEVSDRVAPSYRGVDSQSPKESVWALYCRSMLLWCFCDRFSRDPDCSEEDMAEFAHEAWNETQAITDSLNLHACNLDTGLIYVAREYLYNARMSITQAFRSLQGLGSGGKVITRKQAEEWIYYQQQVISRVKLALRHINTAEGQMLTRRPYQATWYSNQLALCLMLWNNDQSLMNALELAKSFLIPVDVMNALWPCTYIHHQSLEFRNRLTEACEHVGLDPPLPANSSLPPAILQIQV